MNANFTPNQNDYKNLTPFKSWLLLQINTWGQVNFPFVESDFDELTNYGMMQKLMGALNDVIENENEVEQDMTNLFNAFTELQSYVNDYFDNLDVQDEINQKLDNMVLDGTMEQLIGAYVQPKIDAQNEIIGSLQRQINNIVTTPPIPVTSISDMTDQNQIYILTTDGKWYYYDTSESDWVAGGDYQSTAFNNLAQIKPIDIDIQGYLSPSGYINTTAGFKRSDMTEIVDGKTIVTGKLNQSSSGLNVLLIAGYDASETLIYKFFGETGVNNINEQIPAGVKYIIVSTVSAGEFYLNTNVDGINYMNQNHDLAQTKQAIVLTTTGFITTSGTLNPTNGFVSSDYIPCKYGEKIVGHLFGVRDAILYLSYYDVNKVLIDGLKGESDSGTFEVNLNEHVPIDAKYFRLSTRKDGTDYIYVYGYKIVDSLDWIKYININVETKDLFVDASLTDGQVDNITTFNSLTTCLMSTMNEPDIVHNVYVKAGTYDLYTEMGGIDFLASVQPDDTAYTINQPWLYNVNLIGQGNVILNYLPSDEDVSQYPLASDLYAPLNVRGNVNIENIEIHCQNCRYGIQDETGGITKYFNCYHNYKNVLVDYIKGISYGNGLGGGFDNGQTYIFESCYFKSQKNNALSFHNRQSYGGNFIFNNCQFISGTFPCVRFGNVGTQTKSVAKFNCIGYNVLCS